MTRRYSPARIAALGRLEPFVRCSRSELRRIDALMSPRDVPAGRRLTLEGTPGRECFIVERGAVRITRAGEELNVVGPGAWVGELALLDGSVRTATATATADSTVLALNPAEFRTLLADAPTVAAELCSVAQERRSRLQRPAFFAAPALA